MPATAAETDPEAIGWMRGFPPAPITVQNGSFRSARYASLSVAGNAANDPRDVAGLHGAGEGIDGGRVMSSGGLVKRNPPSLVMSR